MSRLTTAQKILLGVLILSFGFLIYDSFSGGGGEGEGETTTRAVIPDRGRESGEQSPGTQQVKVQRESSDWITDLEDVSWGNDPFAHPVPAADTVPRAAPATGPAPVRTNLDSMLQARFRLTAISRKGDDAYVLINNEVLTIGDVLEGAQLRDIRANSVIMETDGKKFVIHLENS